MDEVEAVVIGAGVIGLAAARALALAGREVIVLERAYTIGFETSSRNSEVIHGGLYYPQGSLKARSCVEGRARLYAYCREHGVPYAMLGKLIVATSDEEIPGVEKIEAAARANGVDNLEWLSVAEARRLEPELHCVAALLSPSTGIIDSHALMLAYRGEAEEAGADTLLLGVRRSARRDNVDAGRPGRIHGGFDRLRTIAHHQPRRAILRGVLVGRAVGTDRSRDHREAARFEIGKRLQQDGIDHAENRRVDGNRQRERQDSRERKAGGLAQHAHREADVACCGLDETAGRHCRTL